MRVGVEALSQREESPVAPWERAQDALVDRLKRHALNRLHQTEAGERWIAEAYLRAELQGEASGVEELANASVPDWFRGQMRSHLADERRHVELLRGIAAKAPQSARSPALDPVSRWKLSMMRRTAVASADRFTAGVGVPLLALGLVMEEMGVRFMSRHAEVLQHLTAAGDARPFGAVLESILCDERRHVAQFKSALDRLVAADERQDLESLIRRLRRLDRIGAVAGAVGLLALAYVPRGR